MAMALFNHGDHLLITKIQTEGQIDHVPPHVYRIRPTQDGIVLVKDRKKFTEASKVYGSVEQRANIIVDDFGASGGKPLGFILIGVKGSGKTMLSERIANKLLDRDIPVIVVDDNFPEGLLRAVVRAAAPCMLYFDEFGKYYNDLEERRKLLALFSDSGIGQVMFGVTANSRNELDDFMVDRPGRFKYLIDFSVLGYKAIEEMVKDFKLSGEVADYFTRYCIVQPITYDIALKILPELQKCRSREDVVELLEILNVPGPVYPGYHLMSIYENGKEVTPVAYLSRTRHSDVFHLRLQERESPKTILDTEINFETVKKEVVKEFNPHAPHEAEIIRYVVDETYTLELGVRYGSSPNMVEVRSRFRRKTPTEQSVDGEQDEVGGARRSVIMESPSFHPDRDYRNDWSSPASLNGMKPGVHMGGRRL